MVPKLVHETTLQSESITFSTPQGNHKEPRRRGAHRVMEDGRARTLAINPVFWERTPPPKSAFLRDAIDLYLLSPEHQPERRRAANGLFLPRDPEHEGKVTCVYLPAAQWKKLAELSGAICGHVNAALQRALETRE